MSQKKDVLSLFCTSTILTIQCAGKSIEKGDVMLNRMCTEPIASVQEKKPGAELLLDSEEDEESSIEGGPSGKEILLPDTLVKPIYSAEVWENPDDRYNKRVSVAILMCTDTEKRGDFTINVVAGGEFLEYSVFWPRAMNGTTALHKMWLVGKRVQQLESYHPMVRAFLPFLERNRKKHDGRVESKAKIPLPFAVKSRFEEFTLSFSCKERILYIVLKAPAQLARAAGSEPIAFIDLE